MLKISKAAALIFLFIVFADAQSTEFTYQGSLSIGSPAVPANGNHDFEFALFDSLSGGTQLGATVTRNGVAVTNGAFSVKLDFGSQFPGSDRFLEIRVRQSGGGAFTPLSPRQQVNSSPYSVQSLNAANAANATTAATATNALQLGGVAANQYVLTGDARLSDARNPLPNSANYVQNQNGGPQAASNFNVSGNGKANIFDAATQFNIGGVKILSNSGANNLFAGANAGAANTGPFNAFVGAGAGAANTSGGSNSFFGYNAGNTTQTGDSNSFFGANAGGFSSIGSQNTFIGANAGMNTLGASANENTFVGSAAGISNATGRGNTMLGFGSGVSVGTLSNATAIGNRAVVSQNHSLVLGSISGVNSCTPANNCADTNVGIGTTAPSERLHVIGNGLFTGNLTFGGSLVGNGSGLTNLNAGNITTGTLAVSRGGTGSSTQNFVDLSTDQTTIGGNKTFTGNLTANGNAFVGGYLDVANRSRFRQNFNDTGSLNSAGFWLYQNTTPGSDRAFIGMESDSIVGLYGNQGGGWGLVMNTLSGNVGIGTTTPAGRFHINVPGSGNPISALTLDVGTFGTGANAVNSYFFKVRDLGLGGAPAFLIRGDGNVGVGTASPQSLLHLNGNSGSFGITLTNSANTQGRRGYRIAFDNDRLTFQQATDAGTFSANHMAIDQATGNVGIGTITPASKLDVNGDINATGRFNGDGSGLTNVPANPYPYNPQLLGMLRWDLLPTPKTVQVGLSPAGLAFDGTFMYVANFLSNNVGRIRVSTGMVEGPLIPVGSFPMDLAYDGTFIYVIGSSDNVTRIRASTGQVEGSPIPITGPAALAFDGTFMYVANSSTSVSRIRASTGQVEGAAIPVGLSPAALAFDGTFMYVALSTDANVRRIRASTGTVEGNPIPIGAIPTTMAFDGTFIYVGSRSSDHSSGWVSRIRASSGLIEDAPISVGSPTQALAFDGTFIHVATDGGAGRIRVSNFQLEGPNIPGGGLVHSGLAFDGTFIYMSNGATPAPNNVIRFRP